MTDRTIYERAKQAFWRQERGDYGHNDDKTIMEAFSAGERAEKALHDASATPWAEAAMERVALQENVDALALCLAREHTRFRGCDSARKKWRERALRAEQHNSRGSISDPPGLQ